MCCKSDVQPIRTTVWLCGCWADATSDLRLHTSIRTRYPFLSSQSGSVLLDGFDIRTLQLRWLRNQMGLVSQASFWDAL